MKLHLSVGILCLVALITACGGETPPEEGDNSNLSRSESETRVPEAQAKDSGLGELSALAHDDILRFLYGASGGVNVLYLDVPQAIEALSQPAASTARTELQAFWDRRGFSEVLGVSIRDLDYIAFGENGGSDSDLFLLGGVDFGDLRDVLGDAGFEQYDMAGAEIWVADYEAVAFVGDAAVFGTYDDEDTFDSVLRFSGGYALAPDVLGGGTGKEVLSLLTASEAATIAVLDYLSRAGGYLDWTEDPILTEWMRLDLFRRYAGEDEAQDAFHVWEGGEWPAKLDFARWLSGNKDAMEDFAHWLAGDVDTIEASLRRLTAGVEVDVVPNIEVEGTYILEIGGWGGIELQLGEHEYSYEARLAVERWQDGDGAPLAHVWPAMAEDVRQPVDELHSLIQSAPPQHSLHDEAGDLWAKLPSTAVLKQMDMNCNSSYAYRFDCERFAHAISMENDRQFRLVGVLEYSDLEEAQQDLEGLEAGDIHTDCEATYEMDGAAIRVDALCTIEALTDVVYVD